MHAFRFTLFLLVGILGLGGSCGTPAAPQPAWIADAADVLTAQQEAVLTDMVTAFEQRTGIQLVGVTVTDLGEQSIAAYTRQLANEWGIGAAGVNNGVMVLVAIKQRQVHVEVGRGMEWQINDVRAAEITEMMVPFFREENYEQGLRTGFEQVIAANEGVTWAVTYHTLADARLAGDDAVGQVVSFEAEITKLEEDVAEVKAPGVASARLLLGPHIDPTTFSVEDRLFVHARVKEPDPLVMYLLGWEDEGEL